jgi:ketosteroid isomerase-like protein
MHRFKEAGKGYPMLEGMSFRQMENKMKCLASVAALVLLGASSANAQDAVVEDRRKAVTEELCVVKGSEERRSKMYEATPDSEEIMELERKACWMLAERDLKKLGKEIIDEHGLLFLDGGDILYGRDQQLAMFNEFLKVKGFFLTYEPVEAHVSASKDMAWAFGLYKFKVPDSEMEVGKYVSVWEKKSGKWKNVAEIRNPYKR